MGDELGTDILRNRLEIQPLFAWDEVAISNAEVEYLVEENGMTEEEARESLLDDCDLFQREWDYLSEYVDEWLKKQEDATFFVSAYGLGWRNQSGWTIFTPKDGADFIMRVMGFDTNQFVIRFWESTDALLHATVYHHDSPTGESRYIYTLTDWVRRAIEGRTIQELQKFVTGWRELEDDPWMEAFDQEILGKPRRRYTKEDFATLLREMYSEEWISASDLQDLDAHLDHYINRSNGS